MTESDRIKYLRVAVLLVGLIFLIGIYPLTSWPAPLHVTTPADVQARPYNDRGIALASKGQYEQAISEFNKALELSPVYAQAYYNRGIAHLSMGQYDRAIIDFNRVIELGKEVEGASSMTIRGAAYVPQNMYAQIHYYRGTAYLYKAQYDLAIADFTQALQIDPKHAQAYNNRAASFTEGGRFEQAKSDVDKALQLNPKYALAYMNRGLIYYRQGENDKAISDYNEAIRFDPRLSHAYSNRALAYGKKEQFDEALADFKKALEQNPSSATAHDGLATLYAVQAKYEEAEPLFKKALAIFEKTSGPEHPHVAETLEHYTAMLRKIGREVEAAAMEARVKAIRAKHAR